MSRAYIPARNAAFRTQAGRCYYCKHPMWIGNPEAFAKTHGLTVRQARRFQCTGDHLVAQKDGGKHGRTNIVAACHHCNLTRHRPIVPSADPVLYLAWVSKRVNRRCWHPAWGHLQRAQAGPLHGPLPQD